MGVLRVVGIGKYMAEKVFAGWAVVYFQTADGHTDLFV